MAVLIEDLPVPGYDSAPAFSLGPQFLDLGKCMDRVTKEDRPVEFPVEDRQECQGIDAWRLTHQTRCDGKSKETVCHWPSEGVAVGGRMVDVERIEISGESGEQDDIRFGYGSSWALPLIANDEIIKEPN